MPFKQYHHVRNNPVSAKLRLSLDLIKGFRRQPWTRCGLTWGLLLLLWSGGKSAGDAPLGSGSALQLHARRQQASPNNTNEFRAVDTTLELDSRKTAIVVCDMWNEHWCQGATRRVAEMAPRMNEVLKAARARGVFIIHCPSDTMDYYASWPQRKLAQSAPKVTPVVPLRGWCNLTPEKESSLPIDDADGGCDDSPQCQNRKAWSHQIDTLEIKEGDAITDSAEAYYLMEQRGIKNVIVMGVHLNMCVLGRPFSIRQMVAQGKQVFLMRDLTDTMYNSRQRPFVSHFAGTDLMIQHVEKYWCASITSADFLGGKPFRFSDAKRAVQPDSGMIRTLPPAVSPRDLPSEAPTNSRPLAPSEAAKHFKVAEGFVFNQVVSEPDIAQPVFLNFDERGRMWVVEYRQYPAPAGLKQVSHDNVWRSVYDKVPPPPPNHFRGADRITIHDDPDANGVYRRHKVFVDGLNITTAVERGRGGVWVLNPPYLLFYPDQNNDDVPDADPEVRLSGFGIEDTHSVANSLRWGPDGWLYGCQGSTVTGSILVYGGNGKPLSDKPVFSQGQNIWRYHPGQRRFEIFSEGGGNAFGCEMDAQGRIFSGHNGGDTRGFHYDQGAYLQKGFEKHGPLSNPFAFGFFPPMPHAAIPRFTHNFIIYDGAALPGQYAGKLFGIEPLQGRVVIDEITPDHNSFRTVELGHIVTSDDRWFRPVDIKVGPDGAIYVCDWYDQQVNHWRNYQGHMDASNGRVYRLGSPAPGFTSTFDLGKLSSPQLVDVLSHSNKWFRQTAQRLLADRHDTNLIARLSVLLAGGTGQASLEYLWALQASGGLTGELALRCLQHPEPAVRLWTARLLTDDPQVGVEIASALVLRARSEDEPEVRKQLAASARRLPVDTAIPMVRALLGHDEEAVDNRIPLMIWWALEAHCEPDHGQVLSLLADRGLWDRAMMQKGILERIMRRYAQAGTRADLLTCARILDLAPSPAHSEILMRGFEAAFKGRSLSGLPGELITAMARHGQGSPALRLRGGDAEMIAQAIRTIADESAKPDSRIQFLQVLADMKVPSAIDPVFGILQTTTNAEIRRTALMALSPYDDARICARLLDLYPGLDKAARTTAQTLLSSRPAWIIQLLGRIGQGSIHAETIPLALARKFKEFNQPEIAVPAAKFWPQTGVPTTAEMETRIDHFADVVRGGTGDPYKGRAIFEPLCGACHTLFERGGHVGPDLTPYQRSDLKNMLLSVVNPSAEIREGFETYSIETKDGRELTGFLADQDNQMVALRTIDGQNIHLGRSEITALKASGSSLMPEGLLEAMNEQQIRDLFAYLRCTQPLVGQSVN